MAQPHLEKYSVLFTGNALSIAFANVQQFIKRSMSRLAALIVAL